MFFVLFLKDGFPIKESLSIKRYDMLWQLSFAQMPGKLVQQYERTLPSSSTAKKLLLDTNHEILGDFERLLIRIIHEPQE